MKKTSMPNPVENLRYTTCYCSSSLRPIKSPILSDTTVRRYKIRHKTTFLEVINKGIKDSKILLVKGNSKILLVFRHRSLINISKCRDYKGHSPIQESGKYNQDHVPLKDQACL